MIVDNNVPVVVCLVIGNIFVDTFHTHIQEKSKMATTSKSAGKSGFEIRLEVLQMAKELVEKQAKLTTDFATQAFTLAIQSNQATINQWKEFSPAALTVDEVMAKATELYKFIAPTTTTK
jgi:hypothetical protein